VESSCERGNEPSGSIKCWGSTEWLHNLWPLEWYSAPQSQLVSYPMLSGKLKYRRILRVSYKNKLFVRFNFKHTCTENRNGTVSQISGLEFVFEFTQMHNQSRTWNRIRCQWNVIVAFCQWEQRHATDFSRTLLPLRARS
jgi:hypothetical protein